MFSFFLRERWVLCQKDIYIYHIDCEYGIVENRAFMISFKAPILCK